MPAKFGPDDAAVLDSTTDGPSNDIKAMFLGWLLDAGTAKGEPLDADQGSGYRFVRSSHQIG